MSQQAAEDAWEDYAALARRAVDDPKLLVSRDFFNSFARAERRYKAIFNRLDQHG